MRRIRRASHQAHITESCACHPKQRNRHLIQHLNQERVEQPWTEQECDRFFALSSDIMGIAGFDGYFKRLSPACSQILGFSPEELSAQPFLEFVHPDDRAATIAVVQKLTAGERVDHFENRYRCREGAYKWLSWSGIGVVKEAVIYCTARDITGQKQVEETLQQSKQYYEALIHSLKGVVWEFDLRTQQFLFVSQQAEDILGYPVEQWLNETGFWENHIHPTDRERAIDTCHQFVLQRQEGQVEYRMIAADGRIVWIQDIVSLVIEEDQPIKLRGVLIDITESQRTKEILRRREQEFRALVENSPDVITRVDRSFRYLYVNPKIEERTGIPPADYIGKSSEELGFPEDLITLWHHTAQRVFDTQQEQWMEFEIDSPAGRILNHSRLVPEFAADGSVESVLVVIRDITEHKQLEAALQESEARFRTFMHHSPAAAWITDGDGQIIYVNENCQQISQHLTTDPIGKTVFDLYPAEVAQPLLENIRQVVETQQTLEAIETVPRVDGTLGEFLAYKFLIPNPAQAYLVGGIAIDVTELKRTEADLRESEARYRILASHFPNGVVLLFDRDLRYVLADGTELGVVGLSKAEIEGRTIWEVLPSETCEFVEPFYRAALEGKASVTEVHLANRVYLVHYLPIQNEDERLAAGMVVAQNITDRKQAEESLRYQREQEQLVVSITQSIRQSLNLEEVLDETVTAVQEFLKSDRVLIYCLEPEIGGRVIAESVSAEWNSISGVIINDCYFNEGFAHLYQQGRVQAVDDIYTAGLTRCHVELLAQFQVRANLAVPIAQEGRLWGLLVVQQCSAPRHWQPLEVNLLKQLATQVAIAIQQAELHQQVQQLIANLEAQVQERTLELQQSLEFEALLKRITDKVRDSLDETQILQTAVQELALGLKVQCCDAALYDFEQRSSTIRFEYITSGVPTAEGQTFSFSNLPEVYGQLLQGQYVQFSTLAAPDCWRTGIAPQFTVLSCPLMGNQGVLGDLWLFRPCKNSFNALEVRLVQQVANQCAIALRQSRLYQSAQAQVIELERLNRLKDDFLSTVSHELRTPMSNIKMAIQMLEVMKSQENSSNPKLERTERYFNILRSESEREINLINDLLDLTRLDAGVEPLNLVTIDLQVWLPHVLEPFEQRIHNQQQRLQICLPAALPPITTDLSYLERILTELLNNACKYTPAGEQIRVSVKKILEKEGDRSDSSLLISVCNSGVEIPSSELERIFDKFYRVPNNDPWKHGGTGLGLALVKRLVEKINGKMEVSSHHKQTIFTIQLPLVTEESPSGPTKRPTSF